MVIYGYKIHFNQFQRSNNGHRFLILTSKVLWTTYKNIFRGNSQAANEKIIAERCYQWKIIISTGRFVSLTIHLICSQINTKQYKNETNQLQGAYIRSTNE